MYGVPVHDYPQKQNGSPFFSSIVGKGKCPSLSSKTFVIQQICYHGNVMSHLSSLLALGYMLGYPLSTARWMESHLSVHLQHKALIVIGLSFHRELNTSFMSWTLEHSPSKETLWHVSGIQTLDQILQRAYFKFTLLGTAMVNLHHVYFISKIASGEKPWYLSWSSI